MGRRVRLLLARAPKIRSSERAWGVGGLEAGWSFVSIGSFLCWLALVFVFFNFQFYFYLVFF